MSIRPSKPADASDGARREERGDESILLYLQRGIGANWKSKHRTPREVILQL